MRTMKTGSAVIGTAAVVAMLATGACQRKAPSAGPAGLPPLAPAAASAPTPARPPDTSPAATALAAPSAATKEALARAMGVEGVSQSSAAEAVPDVPDDKDTISGTITLPASNRSRVSRGDVIFLAARRAGGPPGPGSMIAVQKLQADDFPMRFTISGRDAMIPGIPFEGRLSITARVDKDGDALTRRKGDVQGHTDSVRVGAQDVVIALDTVQAEDRMVASPDAVQRAMLPSGHP